MMFKKGKEGVIDLWSPKDKKVEFIQYSDKTLCHVKSALGYPAIYPVLNTHYENPCQAVLMDLDGTSVKSETFWVWIIQKSIAELIKKPKFELEQEDLPHVSGHSVSEHLQYCINKYCPDQTVEEARELYYQITDYEMKEIMEGRGRQNAFTPADGLKDFLLTLKSRNIKIGLVTSGLYQKAMPEIISAFQTLDMGDPLDFYDSIITAGFPLGKHKAGTLGELAPKPHPWLYAETLRVGLGIPFENRNHVIGIEDSSAGIISLRLAGVYAVGMKDGNIAEAGVEGLCNFMADQLSDVLSII